MGKIKLRFNNESQLSKRETSICFNIINIIQQNELITGRELSTMTGLAQPDVRHYIKLIRENNENFLTDSYLIAKKSGYIISSNKQELKTYFKKIQAMTHSKIKQSYQLEEVLNG